MTASSGKRASGKKAAASSSKSASKGDEKETVFLEYACYVCGETKNSASQTINHIEKTHNYKIPHRSVGCKRPKNDEYDYAHDKDENVTIELACPSCWFHCPKDDLKALNKHTLKDHGPVAVTAEDIQGSK